MSSDIQSQILGFILFAIPIVTALWKVFSILHGIEDRVELKIQDIERRLVNLAHQSELRESELEHLNDTLELAVNGVKELVTHVRSRTQADCDRLNGRISQLEKYLTKTTDFQSRE